VLEKERAGGSDEQAIAMFSELSVAALLNGDMENGRAACGAGAGLVRDVVSAGEVVRRIVEGYDRIVAGL
jgi:NAD(P)H-dependent flavin oxidoreductase YrpB (nitropropane dioxygenase family)